ncbi:orotidine-5'-phosphate decarboxylase [Bacteriovorax sp. PP10]|uniref:Orotidine 5'-phosphate decarboxylase n=1 Tax=Bacteriovorax antarcticus TaxID=3088717 RepID=A0ABU5VYK8_9BACT|nr:orotidine-5'-phosphate decarboxylase [Bacteriovorax sp. PP10]MEA9358131.1 orotidine-5'-phosphate decarboxylase [Bacteriovorax sp. PP10]
MSLDRIIVALDQMSIEEIDVFLKQKDNTLPFVKIGLELFVKHGPELVHRIHNDYKKKIFLDLKLHDIPVTVAKAISSLKGLPIDFLTVHLSGGEAMLKAAVAEARVSIPDCKLLGVSFLTSLETTDLEDLFGIEDTDEAFLRLFKVASISGIDGVVSSPLEVSLLKKHFPNLLSVTPGIRFRDEIDSNVVQDQKRVMDPEQAFDEGSDYLVMGRSLTKTDRFSERIKSLQE